MEGAARGAARLQRLIAALAALPGDPADAHFISAANAIDAAFA